MPSDFKPEFFRRIDDSEDELFYALPRFVVHIDDGAIAKVGEIYAQLLPQGGAILDVMITTQPDARGPVLAFIKRWSTRVSKVNVDTIGIGFGLCDHLRDQALTRIEGINVARAAREADLEPVPVP